MSYDPRHDRQAPPRTDTTRHLDKEMDSMVGYLEGARHRSAQFAQSTARLREIHTQIDTTGRDAQARPTGVLSGGDVDIAYYYLGVVLGVLATVYSLVGAVFAFNGGGTAVISGIAGSWAGGAGAAITSTVMNFNTLAAVVLQVVLYIVMIGTRRNRQSWQHWAAIIGSTALTYLGWNSVWVTYGSSPLASITTAIPAFLIGGALAWVIIQGTSQPAPTRRVMIGVVLAGIVAGLLGDSILLQWLGLLLAWSADQVARRVMVIG